MKTLLKQRKTKTSISTSTKLLKESKIVTISKKAITKPVRKKSSYISRKATNLLKITPKKSSPNNSTGWELSQKINLTQKLTKVK